MSYLRPCVRCRFDGECWLQDTVRLKLREFNRAAKGWSIPSGIRLTSALFACKRRWRGFAPGRRVKIAFRWPEHYTVDGDVTDGIERIGGWILDTGIGDAPGKMDIWLDRETKAKGKRRIRLWPMNSENLRIQICRQTRPVAEIQREMEEAAAAYDGREWEDRSDEAVRARDEEREREWRAKNPSAADIPW